MDALKHICFEPNLNGRFQRVNLRLTDSAQSDNTRTPDLNRSGG